MKTELTKWNPFEEMGILQNRLHHFFPSFLGRGDGQAKDENWEPAVDIEEGDEKFIITADLPEVRKDDVKITVSDGTLSISGERKEDEETRNKTFIRIERFRGNYQRSFRLPENVDESKIDATMRSGTLRITLPKTTSPNQKPAREIKIT